MEKFGAAFLLSEDYKKAVIFANSQRVLEHIYNDLAFKVGMAVLQGNGINIGRLQVAVVNGALDEKISAKQIGCPELTIEGFAHAEIKYRERD